MTKTERMKLAKAARELASEYAEGRGPTLIASSWCGCAIGQVFKRAGVSNEPDDSSEWRTPAAVVDIDLCDSILTEATHAQCRRFDEPIPGAVVFPLLYVADVLESAP